MSIFSTYAETKKQFRDESSSGKALNEPPFSFDNSVRAEIFASGWIIVRYQKGVFKDIACRDADSYENSIKTCAAEIAKLRWLRKGVIFIQILWPSVKNTPIQIGPSAKARSLPELQKILSYTPSAIQSLEKESGEYLFQGFEGKTSSDPSIISFSKRGLDILTQITPKGVISVRYWGPMTALLALIESGNKDTDLSAEFALKGIIGIVDSKNIYYFPYSGGTILGGIRIANRSELKNVTLVQQNYGNFNLDNCPIIYYNCTPDNSDIETLINTAGVKINIASLGRDEGFKLHPHFETIGSSPLLSLGTSLTRNDNGINPSFLLATESDIPLTVPERAFTRTAGVLKFILLVIVLLSTVLIGLNIGKKTKRPEWNIDRLTASNIDIAYKKFISDRALFLRLNSYLKNINRVDYQLLILLGPAPSSIILKSITMDSLPGKTETFNDSFQDILISGTCAGEIEVVNSYAQYIGDQFKESFPERIITVNVIGTAREAEINDTDRSLLNFKLSIKLENTPRNDNKEAPTNE